MEGIIQQAEAEEVARVGKRERTLRGVLVVR